MFSRCTQVCCENVLLSCPPDTALKLLFNFCTGSEQSLESDVAGTHVWFILLHQNTLNEKCKHHINF